MAFFGSSWDDYDEDSWDNKVGPLSNLLEENWEDEEEEDEEDQY